MKRCIFATNNPGKLDEIRRLIGDNIRIISLQEAGIEAEIPEDHDTFHDNARQKAEFVFERTGIPVFADDSGLEVEALGGRPGVFSARYAGEDVTPQDNIDKLMDELRGVRDRNARFITVIALKTADDVLFFEGSCKGVITEEQSGTSGFGYDPVFRPDGYGETFAEMSPELKNEISHRGEAVRKLITCLNGNA